MHAMPTVTDAASETMVRRDMTDPFLRLMTELSHKESSATRLCKNDRGSCFLVIAMVAPGEPGVSGAPYRERPSVLGIRKISVIG